jgi:small subunit ribosomal protein S10
MRTHKRLIDVLTPTDKTSAALEKLEIPAGVDVVMEVK